MKNVTPYELFEREATDAQYRRAAVECFSELVRYVEANVDFMKPTPDGVYLIYSSSLKGGIYDKYGHFFIALKAKTNGPIGGFGRFKKGPLAGDRVIVLEVLLKPGDLKWIETRLPGRKGTFIHEFIHLMDDERHSGKAAQSSRSWEAGDPKGYYNNPSEYNAYYQELAYQIDGWLDSKNIPQEIKKQVISLDFEEFLEATKTQFGVDEFIENLTPENRKRFIKRLYDYHQTRVVGELYKQPDVSK